MTVTTHQSDTDCAISTLYIDGDMVMQVSQNITTPTMRRHTQALMQANISLTRQLLFVRSTLMLFFPFVPAGFAVYNSIQQSLVLIAESVILIGVPFALGYTGRLLLSWRLRKWLK